jgi:hypothetical protein
MLCNPKVKETVRMSLSKLYRPIAKTQVSRQDNDTFIAVSEISQDSPGYERGCLPRNHAKVPRFLLA